MKIININKYGILPNEGVLITERLQKIIDNAPKNAVIYFPKGTYILSTIYLKSNLTIKLSKFATILGSDNFYDYALSEKIDYPLYQDASHSFFNPSMFVGKNLKNINIIGNGTINMRSVWDEDNIRDIVHRGAKCIALRECDNVLIDGIKVLYATDLAIYFAGCNNVVVRNCNLKVHIDGISPDNSKHVLIENCNVLAGDDAIVFKSSYTLNRLDICDDIEVRNCKLASRCNCVKFGTETNGGFHNIRVHDIEMKNTRISGIAVESVDGAIVDDIHLENIVMKNINNPIFVHLGTRMRGPEGREIGQIKNIYFKNIKATGPYRDFKSIAWNYVSFIAHDDFQRMKVFGGADGVNFKNPSEVWQMTSNVCGLVDHYLENINFENIDFVLAGGCLEYSEEVPEKAQSYPEAYVYGRVLPASGFFFRHIKGLNLKNVSIRCIKKDKRPLIVYRDVI